jgi:hypothetical protein
VALYVEGVVDGSVCGKELLSASLRFEPLHDPFPSTDRLVRVLRPIVPSKPSGSVAAFQTHRVGCRPIQGETVGHDPLRLNPVAAKQLAQEPQRRSLVAPPPDEHVQHLTLTIDGSPQ